MTAYDKPHSIMCSVQALVHAPMCSVQALIHPYTTMRSVQALVHMHSTSLWQHAPTEPTIF